MLESLIDRRRWAWNGFFICPLYFRLVPREGGGLKKFRTILEGLPEQIFGGIQTDSWVN